jgi:hypothetical protein
MNFLHIFIRLVLYIRNEQQSISGDINKAARSIGAIFPFATFPTGAECPIDQNYVSELYRCASIPPVQENSGLWGVLFSGIWRCVVW